MQNLNFKLRWVVIYLFQRAVLFSWYSSLRTNQNWGPIFNIIVLVSLTLDDHTYFLILPLIQTLHCMCLFFNYISFLTYILSICIQFHWLTNALLCESAKFHQISVWQWPKILQSIANCSIWIHLFWDLKLKYSILKWRKTMQDSLL